MPMVLILMSQKDVCIILLPVFTAQDTQHVLLMEQCKQHFVFFFASEVEKDTINYYPSHKLSKIKPYRGRENN